MREEFLKDYRDSLLNEAFHFNKEIKHLLMRQGVRMIEGNFRMAQEIGEVIFIYKQLLKDLRNEYKRTVRELEHTPHIGSIGADENRDAGPWSRTGLANYKLARIKQQDLGAS